MTTVDSKIEDLRSQIQGSPGNFASTSEQPQPESPSGDALPSSSDNSPLLRSIKMEVPKFDGSDPIGWIFRIEEFFYFHGTPNSLHLRIASFHMEGRAAAWYQWMKANHLFTTWKEFLQNLGHRFGASVYDDPQGTLSKLA